MFGEGAGYSFLGAVGTNQHPEADELHVELVPQAGEIVGKMRHDLEAVAADKQVHVRAAVLAGNANEGQAFSVLCLQRCDRRRFSLALRSERRPEPQQDVTATDRRDIEQLAVEPMHR